MYMRKVFNKSDYPKSQFSVCLPGGSLKSLLGNLLFCLGLFYLTWLLKRFKLHAPTAAMKQRSEH